MEQYQNGEKYETYIPFEKKLNEPYDYARKGLLKKLMSSVITDSKNPVLQFMLTYEEKSLVFIMKYVDILKNFRNWYWRNR